MDKCKSCGADIVWKKTQAGKPVPLNPPEKRFIDQDGGRVYVMLVDTYVSHFATCPNAAQHRKKANG